VPENPYARILAALKKSGADFVVIGLSGINFYADAADHAFSTGDCDLLAAPRTENLLKILKALTRAGYELVSNGEPLGAADAWLAGKIIERRAVVSATRGPALMLDIVIDGGGIPYPQWRRHAKPFLVQGARILVGSLPDLLAAKENAGRDKDRKFLELYRIHLKEMLKSSASRRKKRT